VRLRGPAACGFSYQGGALQSGWTRGKREAGIGAAYNLTVELNDETQDTVRRWMLRTKVKHYVLGLGHFDVVVVTFGVNRF
jgi:hypothetical protein